VTREKFILYAERRQEPQ